jgi:hypothetical protein
MTCGAIVWPFSLNRMPGWQPGVRGRANRTAGRPLPCCRDARRGARTSICYGVQPYGTALMLTARAEECASRDPDAEVTSNSLALPAQRRAEANRRQPNSSPVAARRERP